MIGLFRKMGYFRKNKFGDPSLPTSVAAPAPEVVFLKYNGGTQMNLISRPVTVMLFLTVLSISIFAQSTEFSYQGSLQNSSVPANGNYDFEFRLYDLLNSGTQQGITLQRLNVVVTNGNFNVSLDFGAAAIPGADRFLEIAVRAAGGGSFTPLTPRQKVNTVPYATRSLNAATADSVSAGGIPSGSGNYIQNSSSQQASSNFNISGTGTANIFSAAQFNIGVTRALTLTGDSVFVGATGLGGSANTFVGNNAGSSIQNGGNNNVFVGWNAGLNNTTGLSNSFIGLAAGFGNTTGFRNAFFGRGAGLSNTTGTFNTAIGEGSNVGAANLTNATAIGAQSLVSQSNSLVLGSINGVNSATADTNVGIGTTAPQKTLHVVGQDIRVEGSSGSISPRFSLVHMGGSAGGTPDRGKWQNYAVYDPFFGGLRFSALNDAENQESIWLNVVRVPGITINRVEFPSGYVAIGNDLLVGTTSVIPTRKLDVRGSAIVLDSSNLGFRVQTNTAGGTVASFGGNGEFRVDAPGVTGGRFTILENGNVGIGTNSPSSTLHVNGSIRLGVVGSGGTQNLCWAADQQIATCSSSLRYKTNIGSFSSGMSFVNQLRPISFDWKDGGLKDVGFGAEEIAKIDPRFVTYNDKGEVEGVKYDRMSVAFVNAFKEQQAQIESQQEQIEQQRSEIEALKALVCLQTPGAAICRPKK